MPDIYTAHLCCAQCGTKLNESLEMDLQHMCEAWARLVMTKGFNAGACPNGCQPTFSDLNLSTTVKLFNVSTGMYEQRSW